jgi:two-component system, cell cycle response regulator
VKVLIAEDDGVTRLLLQRAVERLDHECLGVEDGLQALAAFQQDQFDVVISDWMMPGLDGPDLCRRVRAMESMHYSYFILLTALADKGHFLSGMEAGADDYLQKPFDREELQVRLQVARRVTSLHRQLADKNAELERLSAAMATSARTDPLTQLSNRLRLREDLESLQGRVERYNHGYCLALLDVDQFKAYNDCYGHQAGDRVLQEVASTIGQQLRTGDQAYRYGGEEFLVILPEQPMGYAESAVNRLLKAVERLAIPHTANPPSGVVTISAGLSLLRQGQVATCDDILHLADQALYRAKAAGRNQLVAQS